MPKPELLEKAGFTDITERDLTLEYQATSDASARERALRATQVIAAEGEARYRERLADYHAQSRAIASGLLRRALYVARNP